jgi:hypothetical protein
VHAEFELKASDFERHDHDPEDVDYIMRARTIKASARSRSRVRAPPHKF